MAGTPSLSSTVERFVRQKLPSIEHLETLGAVHSEPARWWTGAAIGAALGTSPAQASRILEELCSANLLEVRVSSDVVYRYKPGSAEIEERVGEVIDALRRSRAQVYALVVSGSARVLRDFADAFRLRRHDVG